MENELTTEFYLMVIQVVCSILMILCVLKIQYNNWKLDKERQELFKELTNK